MTSSRRVMFILGCLSVLFMAQSAQAMADWNKVWDGPVGTVVGSANSGLYVTRQDTGDIYMYRGGEDWEKIGGPAKKFIANDDGLFGLSPDGQGIWHFAGWQVTIDKAGDWTQIGGPASAIYGGGHVLLATNPDTGDLYLYTGTPMRWLKIGGPGKDFAVINSDNIVGLSPDSKGIWLYEGPWIQIGGPAKEIYSSTTSKGLYATNPETGDIYAYDFSEKEWTRIGGPGKMFAATADNLNLYGLSNDGSIIWKYMGVPDDWEQIGGPAAEIYACGNSLYHISPVQRNLLHYIA